MKSMPSRVGAFLWQRVRDVAATVIPPACCVCNVLCDFAAEAGVCASCWAQVEYLGGPVCPRCGRPHPGLEDDDFEGILCGGCQRREPPFQAGVSMAHYRGPLKTLIRLFKFSDRPELARPLASRALTVLRSRAAMVKEFDRIVPVPLPLLRRVRRGYNQATLLARELGRRLEIPVDVRALRRRGLGRPQTSMPANRRAANIRGAFLLRRRADVAGRSILLVDDVWTTGATLSECSRVLRHGGALRVVAFSLARTPDSFDLEASGGLD
ncbi:MAG: ComF family protein [Acidobacteria bacterium]|nr:MAG: ComF family protein [Acidobacteriota bacterium]